MKTLLVRAGGAAMVPRLEAMNANPREFVAREWVTVEGKAALAPTKDPVEVPARAEYVRAVRDGDLLPANAETAAFCGVALPAEESAE